MAADPSREAAGPAQGPGVRAPKRAPLAGAVLAAMWLLVLGAAIPALPGPAMGGAAALWLYLALRLRHVSAEVWGHLALAVGLSLWVLGAGETGLAATAWQRAATVAALVAGLAMLRMAAAGTPMVQRTGALVAAQPAGRRYLAMSFGAHVVGLILNFGVCNVLSPVLASLRSMALRVSLATAVLRGFATTFLWSPLTLSFGVVTSGIAGIDIRLMLGTGLGAALLLLLMGWLLDRRGRRRLAAPAPPAATSRTDAAGAVVEGRGGGWAVAALIGLIGTVTALMVAIHLLLGVPMLVGVILGAPLVALPWLALRAGSAQRAPARLGRALSEEAAEDGHTITVLAAAAATGTLIGGLLPEEAVRAVLLDGPVPRELVPMVLMLAVLGLGVLGANPLLSVVLVIGLFPDPAAVGLMPEALGLALMASWGLTTGVSRGGAALLMVSRAIGSTPFRLGLGSNLVFTLAAAAFVGLVAALLPALTGFGGP